MYPPALDLPPSPDLEKSPPILDTLSADTEDNHGSPSIPVPNRCRRWNAKIESLAGLEARGITRVLPEERHAATLKGYVQMALLWFSANLTANNLAVGLLGPLVFSLGFVDSALCSVFGAFVGSVGTAYMSTWGAQSGNRTMVCCSFSKLPSNSHFDSANTSAKHKKLIRCVGRGSVLYGIHAIEDRLRFEYYHHGWVRYH